jgi:hypothetical protein
MDFDQCDNCYMGPSAVQISSTIGVAEHAASLFEQVKSACPNAKHGAEVAKSWKAGTVAAPKEDVENYARYYTVKKGDTCAGIALSQNFVHCRSHQQQRHRCRWRVDARRGHQALPR